MFSLHLALVSLNGTSDFTYRLQERKVIIIIKLHSRHVHLRSVQKTKFKGMVSDSY
jgi:hypothetical protein